MDLTNSTSTSLRLVVCIRVAREAVPSVSPPTSPATSTPNNLSSKVAPSSYQMVESAASTNSIKCLIQPAQSSMKSWNNKPFPSQKQGSLPRSTPEQVS